MSRAKIMAGRTITCHQVDMAVINTEYSQELTQGTVGVVIQCSTAHAMRVSFETGKVAGPTSPYWIVKSGDKLMFRGLLLLEEDQRILYFACANAGSDCMIIETSVS